MVIDLMTNGFDERRITNDLPLLFATDNLHHWSCGREVVNKTVMEKINLNIFGNRLKFYMFERDVAAKSLAKMVGVAQNTVSMYTTNQRIPPLDIFMRIARALELSDDEILSWIKLL